MIAFSRTVEGAFIVRGVESLDAFVHRSLVNTVVGGGDGDNLEWTMTVTESLF